MPGESESIPNISYSNQMNENPSGATQESANSSPNDNAQSLEE